MEKPEQANFISRYIAVAASTISRLRCNPAGGEYEYRLVEQLALLASGRAVIDGSREVLPEHLGVVKHVTFSAAPFELRPILSALFDSPRDHNISTDEVETLCSCVKETALNRMRQLHSTGICKYIEGKAPNNPSTIALSGPFTTLATGGET